MFRIRWLIAACFVGICLVPSVRADRIDKYLREEMRLRHIPGVSLAVVKNGKVVKLAGYGVANIEDNTPATPNSIYELGSVTKQFTAAALMLLVEEDKIRLDDRISKYFPGSAATWSGITIRHLLTHTSGVQNHVAVPGYLGRFKTDLFYVTSPSKEEAVKMFLQLPLEFSPGETWAYDNTGYYLLGIIIEKVSGKPYFEFLNDRIFRPLGMSATRSTDPQTVVPNRVSGYDWVKDKYVNRPVLMPDIAFSAGSIISTVGDMAKWDAALYTDRILGASSRNQMWTATRGNDGATLPFDYGFGWFIDNYRGHRLVQHTGGTPGFSSAFYRFIDDGLTVIILTNHSDTIIDHWAIDIAATYVPSLSRRVSRAAADPKFSAGLRTQLIDAAKGKANLSEFTEPMRKFLGTATGKGLFGWYLEGGEIQGFELSSIEDRPDGRMLRYRLTIGGSVSEVSFFVTRDNKTGQMLFW